MIVCAYCLSSGFDLIQNTVPELTLWFLKATYKSLDQSALIYIGY